MRIMDVRLVLIFFMVHLFVLGNNDYPFPDSIATTALANMQSDDFAEGSGTKDDPYRISTARQLDNIRKIEPSDSTLYFQQINDIDLTEATSSESGEFYNSGRGWLPIPNSTINYDGGGFSIFGMNIFIESDTEDDYFGLFSASYSINIENLSLVGGNIIGEGISAESLSIGGITGLISNGHISNCYSSVNIDVSLATNMELRVGGIAGLAIMSTIDDSYYTGDISISASSEGPTLTGGIGGIIGYAYEVNESLERCYSAGRISVDNSFHIEAGVGGIAGQKPSELTDCYYLDQSGLNNTFGTKLTWEEMLAPASFSGFDFGETWSFASDSAYLFPVLQILYYRFPTENTDEFDGGMGTSNNPYKVSSIKQLDNVRKYKDAWFVQTENIDMSQETSAGGEFYDEGLGWLPIPQFSGTYNGNGYLISGVKINRPNNAGVFGLNEGTILNLGVINGAIISSDSTAYVGAIAAVNKGTIRQCYNKSYVSGSNAGGIVGNNDGGLIEASYNKGAISSEFPVSILGGICGINANGGRVNDVYNRGNIFYSTGVFAYIGGLVGTMELNSNLSFGYSTAEFEETPSKDDIGSGTQTVCIGEIIGSITDTNISLVDLFYIESSELLGVGNSAVNPFGVSGITSEQLKNQGNLGAYDFSNVWSLSEDLNNGYPYLHNISEREMFSDLEKNVLQVWANNNVYSFTINITNLTQTSVTTDVYAVLFNDEVVTGVDKYSLTNLANGDMCTIKAKLNSSNLVNKIKVICMNSTDLIPVGEAYELQL